MHFKFLNSWCEVKAERNGRNFDHKMGYYLEITLRLLITKNDLKTATLLI